MSGSGHNSTIGYLNKCSVEEERLKLYLLSNQQSRIVVGIGGCLVIVVAWTMFMCCLCLHTIMKWSFATIHYGHAVALFSDDVLGNYLRLTGEHQRPR